MIPLGLVARPARAIGRRAEGVALATLDAALESRLAAEAVDRVLASDLAARAIARALDGPLGEALETPAAERMLARVLESRLVDEAVRRVLAGEELWLVVDEVAQSPAVTEAIARQSVSFADQVAGQVRDRSRSADARLERVARRVLRRPPEEQ
jgi:hypothetical protein